jgi:AraC-like DNA-binding protein
MGLVQKFATAGVAPGQRLRYWNDLVDRIYGGTFVDAPGGEFSGEMLSWSLGELDMIRPRSGPSVVGRSPRQSSEERIILHLQSRGRSLHSQQGQESALEPGDFVLCSPHQPYRMDISAHEFLVVEFPRAPLAERFPGIDDAMLQQVCGRSPGGRVFHDFLLSLWRQGDRTVGDHSWIDPDWEAGIVPVFYDMVALAMRSVGARTDVSQGSERLFDPAFRGRVLALVEADLCDPALRTTSLAQACHASVRTIQNLFAGMGTTPSAYILDRRLERAAERLAAEPWRSVTEIAFAHGFNDSAYFTRCFRQRFGTAPREWRLGENARLS